MAIALVVVVALAAQPDAVYKKESKRALSLYAKESYKEAVVAFKKALAALAKAPNRNAELETRKYLTLALYNSGKKNDALNEYRALKLTAPRFRFDPDEVLPETIAFFETASPPLPLAGEGPTERSDVRVRAEAVTQPTVTPTPTPPPAPASAPVVEPPVVVAAPDTPRELKPDVTLQTQPAVKRWHWYYLTPLGIGQYLAGSPVRGTLFLLLQAGFTALNVAGYILYSRELIYADGTARDARSAQLGQTLMNVGFFGIIGSVVAGTVDGAFLEP